MMKILKRYAALIIMILIFVAALFWFISLERNADVLHGVTIFDSEHQIQLKPYYNGEEDRHYLFLPSHLSTYDLVVECEGDTAVFFSADGINQAESIGGLPLMEDVLMTVVQGQAEQQIRLQLWQCQSVPAIHVVTHSGTMEYINDDKQHREDIVVTMIDADGDVLHQGTGELSGRGNGTWGSVKNPYNLSLSAPLVSGEFVGITELCLLANYSDPSHLRNAIAHRMAAINKLAYTSPYEFVDLYANGEYLGLYAMATKRMYESAVLQEITAAFEIIPSEEECTFMTSGGVPIKVLYGDKDIVEGTVSAFESALRGGDWETVAAMADIDSFIGEYVLDEAVNNEDLAWWGSHYFYLDREQKIHCMCPWDHDFTFDRALNTDMLKVYSRYVGTWEKYLIQYDEFCAGAAEMLQQCYTDDFCDEIYLFTADTANHISASWKCDAVRYGKDYDENTLAQYCNTYDQMLRERIQFVEDSLLEIVGQPTVQFISTQPQLYQSVRMKTGTPPSEYLKYITTNEFESTYGIVAGWYTEDGRSLEEIETITEDIVFNARWEKTVSFAKGSLMWVFRNYGYRLPGTVAMYFLLLFILAVAESRSYRKRKVVVS